MTSLIEGYNYDIFISYRQKDNKGDRWVSEFVEALKTELESTFKEEISVYFDINPHDGLLETHDVDESLKEKLKCLVFIPIISRTYCDPMSFAWKHEFKAFVEHSSHDQFGLKVKLPNGNVANRVLPIRIHDLDADDIKLCESVLGGVPRGIEFIYKEPGVNKPLNTNDNEKKNLNNTNYRIQINKTTNAIKEIVSGLKTGVVGPGTEKIQLKVAEKEINRETSVEECGKPVKLKVIKLLSGFLITVILVAAAILAYPKIFKRNTLENLRSSGERISVAVMPFQNMTNDTIWNVWQEGIKDELINYLTNFEELEVRQSEESINGLIQGKDFTNYVSITPSVASSISRKLDSKIFIYGTIKRAGTIIRVNAQLIDAERNEILKSFQIERPSKEEMIFNIIDSLSKMVKDFLIISNLKRDNVEFQDITSTSSPEAYRYYILGKKAYYKGDNDAALNWLKQAIAIDSNFTWPMRFIIGANRGMGRPDKGREWCIKWVSHEDKMSIKEKLWAYYENSLAFQSPYEAVKYLKQLQEIDHQNPPVYFSLGFCYMCLQQYDNAIPEYEKALEIYNKWGSKPMSVDNYARLEQAYHYTGQYEKEKELYEKAEHYFPDNPDLLYRQAILSLTEVDNRDATKYIEKYRFIRKENSWVEADVITSLAEIYSEAGMPDQTEKYYREALKSMESDSDKSRYLNNLAYFLIDKDRNINEGMELAEKTLKLRPDNYYYLHTKGWGLYKKEKFKEALDILQKSWDLGRKNAILYDHTAFLHLEAAKKAVANQKNN